ncbi:hypothetical protein BD410DRAFT_710403 [Rickenella mellea]|uniref:Bud emergence protein 1 n=1 Tax=Rickenella mellea TaxID=50990 RepID=A0A4R5XF69_9AGAM|nr:hypothetical protein BD410DRAFT_710403 [Rickenella mellea]
MKSLRRSLNTKDHSPLISTPIPAVSKPAASIIPPNKVIRALEEHRPGAPNQLGFQKGDFFYVVNDSSDGWYEANNPMTGARGLVPKSKFEEFKKANAGPKSGGSTKSPPASPRQPVFYAVVEHDFNAERADELDAKRGDHISIVAQSNYEWFVAKPISRLGRPGLIPVSFVSIHDPGTGKAMTDEEVKALMYRGEVPGVDEWKKAILDYKAASISLGVIDDESTRGPVPNSPFMPSSSQYPSPEKPPQPPQPQESEPSPPPCLPPGSLLTAEVVSWHYEMEEYWFRIGALFQPDDPSDSSTLPPAKQLVLFRVYNDFYDFQVNLLDSFPFEAGRAAVDGPKGQQQKSTRILPYMPGPAAEVDDKITIMRREELDAYLVQLCGLWQYGADHILRHRLIREFFAPKAGDVEEDVEAPAELLEERYGQGYSYASGAKSDQQEQYSADEQIRRPFDKLNVRDRDDDERSDGSRYDEETNIPPLQAPRSTGRSAYDRDDRSNGSGAMDNKQRSYSPAHQRDMSTTSAFRDSRSHSPYGSQNRTDSPLPERTASSMSTQTRTADAQGYRAMQPPRLNTDFSDQNQGQDSPMSNPSLMSPRSTNNPPISASNPNTAFVKVKIFDRLTQELIAIRVNPRVTHAQLMDKVRARLGGDVQHLSFRNSVNNSFLSVEDDNELRHWMEETDKHVLYAD